MAALSGRPPRHLPAPGGELIGCRGAEFPRRRLARGDRGDARTGRRAARGLPRRAAGALLPDARLRRRGRGPGPGDAAAGLAGRRPVRPAAGVAAHLAAPDRDQRLPHRPARAGPGGRCRAGWARPATTRRRRSCRGSTSRGCSRSRTAGSATRPTPPSSAPGCGWPWSRRCSCCRRGSARRWCCARCSQLPAAEVAAGAGQQRRLGQQQPAAGPGHAARGRAGARGAARARRPRRAGRRRALPGGVRGRRRPRPDPAAGRRRRAGDAAGGALARRPGALPRVHGAGLRHARARLAPAARARPTGAPPWPPTPRTRPPAACARTRCRCSRSAAAWSGAA